jgi:ABC-type multidrug transport system ATPase subunit
MNDVIEVTGLVKDFGRTRALDGLDLAVRAGEVHGFLGPNGSGKSTTIRALLGLLRIDGGTARLLDGDPWRESTALHRVQRARSGIDVFSKNSDSPLASLSVRPTARFAPSRAW